MQVDYLHAPPVRLPDLTDDELPDAVREHVFDKLADVERVEIVRTAKRRPILCLDFDGVLHSYVSGWQGVDVASDPPVDGAAAFLYSATQHGFDVAVLSSRSKDAVGREVMRRYVVAMLDDEYGGDVADAVMFSISFPEHKPPAHVTLDDRAIGFEGTFPHPVVLKLFKPWNRRDE